MQTEANRFGMTGLQQTKKVWNATLESIINKLILKQPYKVTTQRQ